MIPSVAWVRASSCTPGGGGSDGGGGIDTQHAHTHTNTHPRQINIGGGFLITGRMLDLFKRPDDPKEHPYL